MLNFNGLTWINIGFFTLVVIALSLTKPGSNLYAFLVGCFFSQYLSGARLILATMWNSFFGHGRKFSDLEPNKYMRAYIILGCAIILALSSLFWYAQWEMTTGVYLGYGVVIGSFIFAKGIGRCITDQWSLPPG